MYIYEFIQYMFELVYMLTLIHTNKLMWNIKFLFMK